MTAYWVKVIRFFSLPDHRKQIMITLIHPLFRKKNKETSKMKPVYLFTRHGIASQNMLWTWQIAVITSGLLLIVVLSPIFEMQTADWCRWVMGDHAGKSNSITAIYTSCLSHCLLLAKHQWEVHFTCRKHCAGNIHWLSRITLLILEYF